MVVWRPTSNSAVKATRSNVKAKETALGTDVEETESNLKKKTIHGADTIYSHLTLFNSPSPKGADPKKTKAGSIGSREICPLTLVPSRRCFLIVMVVSIVMF